jgi:ribosomal protein S18 acetylase RimI-like enzyme
MTFLRHARPDDIEALRAVEADADLRFVHFGHAELADGSVVPAEVAARAIADGRIIVSLLDDAVVGWVWRARLGDEACVAQLSVARAYGRRGIGTALLGRAVKDAAEAGEPSIVLATQSDVPYNRPWYERQGFAVVLRADWSTAMVTAMHAQVEGGLDAKTRIWMRRELVGRAERT